MASLCVDVTIEKGGIDPDPPGGGGGERDIPVVPILAIGLGAAIAFGSGGE